MNELFRISHNNEKYSKPVQFHSHDFYEIYFFVNGNVKYYIEDETYDLTRGDVLIIPAGKLHRPVIQSNLPYDRYVLWLYGSYSASNAGIRQFLDAISHEIENKETRLVSFKGNVFKIMISLFDELLDKWCRLYGSADLYSLEYNSSHNTTSDIDSGESTLEQLLLTHVCASDNILILERILDSFKTIKKIEDIDNSLIQQVISYINCNVTDSPLLDELASKFFVSKYYLSHQFKEYTKLTIHQYILSKKINLAKEWLESGKNPQQVCNLCGFSTYSNFYKVFTKQTGDSPREFLNKTQNPTHMKVNADVNFEITTEDMEKLKNFKHIESYGNAT